MTTIGAMGLSGMDALYFELSETEDEIRKSSRDARRAAEQGHVQAMMEQADSIETAALLDGLAGIAQGAGQIASGGLGIAGTTGTLTSETAQASQQLTTGSATATSAVLGYFAGVERADQKRLEAQATSHESAAADAREIEQDARDAQEKLARRLESAQGAQAEARRAALRA
jgi:hypothetical protein